MDLPEIKYNEAGEVVVNASDSPDIMQVLEAGVNDSKIFFPTAFPDNFYKQPSELHEAVIETIDMIDHGVKKIVIQAPRGIGKTTTATALAGKRILMCENRFIPYVSKSHDFAAMQTENLKADLMESEFVRNVFGNIKVGYDKSMQESWSKKSWIANVDSHQTFILPRGSGQQVRGLKWRRWRPDGCIVDDLEDTETIDNEDIRKKRKEWFFGDLLKFFETGGAPWWIVYIDTLKHEDSLMAELLELKDWEKLNLAICDDNYQTLAPDFMSQEEIDAEVQEARDTYTLDVFARERMGQTISKEQAAFKQDMWKYYKETDPEFLKQKSWMESFLIVDPSKTTNPRSAETGFVVWGVNTKLGRFYIRYAAGEKIHPDQQIDRAFELAATFGCKVIGVESTGLGEWVTHAYRNEAGKRGLPYEFIDLKSKAGQGEFSGKGGAKMARVASLLPYYRKGQVHHNEIGTGALEIQLLGYPKSKRWDIMDAAGYLPKMLDEGERYFLYQGEQDFEEEGTSEKEYRELEKDDYPEMDDSYMLV